MPGERGQCCEHPGLGGILFEIPLWCILHYTFGTSAPQALAASYAMHKSDGGLFRGLRLSTSAITGHRLGVEKDPVSSELSGMRRAGQASLDKLHPL